MTTIDRADKAATHLSVAIEATEALTTEVRPEFREAWTHILRANEIAAEALLGPREDERVLPLSGQADAMTKLAHDIMHGWTLYLDRRDVHRDCHSPDRR